MDPKLQARLSQQRQKADCVDEDLEVVDPLTTEKPAGFASGMDPILAARFAKQQQKLETGESAVEKVGSKASWSTTLDPVLAQRLARQNEKLQTGESAVEDIGSAHGRQLAQRLAQQKEKAKVEERKKLEANAAIQIQSSERRRRARQVVAEKRRREAIQKQATVGRRIVEDVAAPSRLRQRKSIPVDDTTQGQDGSISAEADPDEDESPRIDCCSFAAKPELRTKSSGRAWASCLFAIVGLVLVARWALWNMTEVTS